MSYKSVAVWGGTGNLGPAIVNNLVSAGLDVTVLSRHATLPDTVSKQAKVVQIDVMNVEPDKLATTLKDIDVVISTVGNAGFTAQTKLIDASIQAGVKLFFPSEFGSDTSNPLASALPVFGHKVQVQEYIKQRAAEDKIGYVLLNNSAFLDWGLRVGFIFDATDSRPSPIYNGGDVKFSATTLDDVGKVVVRIIQDPEPYWNRQVLINSAVVTQNQLLAAAKKARPDGKWATEQRDTEVVRKEGLETLKSGQGDIGGAMVGFIMSAVFNPAYGGEFDQADSKRLGLKHLSAEEVDGLVKEIALESSN